MTSGRQRSGSFSNYMTSWEPRVARSLSDMAEQQRLKNSSAESNSCRPFMVALVGLPGSGKSVSSMLLANELDKMDLPCFVTPHDGYHLYMHQLRLMPDPQDYIYRRGAPDTFDPKNLYRDLLRIRGEHPDYPKEDQIKIPAFDHSKGDPEPDKHVFDRFHHKIVLCEGLYLLHKEDGWENIASLFDFTIFIKSDIDACMERVKVRNLCIPGYTPDEIRERVEKVDRVNAMTVLRGIQNADLVVDSLVVSPEPARLGADTLHRVTESSVSLAALDLEVKDYQSEAMENDWTMEITSSRPRGDSLTASSQGDTIFSDEYFEDNLPEPVGRSAGRWEPEMADRIVQLVNEKGREPIMVALAAGPGTGKSLSAMVMANILEEKGYPTMVMPHDGYHYTLDYLRSFPDPQDMIYRRGAPDTFDPHALLRDLRRVRAGDEDIIKLPAFDHARGDPEPETHVFDRSRHRVVICEGLYLLHQRDGWEPIADEFDLKIFLAGDIDVCMDRVKLRNRCIPGYTEEEIFKRVDRVDRQNFLTVLSSKHRADYVVDSSARD